MKNSPLSISSFPRTREPGAFLRGQQKALGSRVQGGDSVLFSAMGLFSNGAWTEVRVRGDDVERNESCDVTKPKGYSRQNHASRA